MSCSHPVQVHKFGGALLCTRCMKVVGYWKAPQPQFNVTFVKEEDE